MQNRPWGPKWVALYGAPDSVDYGTNKNHMNRHPEIATNYRGRLLVSMRVADNSSGKEVYLLLPPHIFFCFSFAPPPIFLSLFILNTIFWSIQRMSRMKLCIRKELLPLKLPQCSHIVFAHLSLQDLKFLL